jgi:hypothetical protein
VAGRPDLVKDHGLLRDHDLSLRSERPEASKKARRRREEIEPRLAARLSTVLTPSDLELPFPEPYRKEWWPGRALEHLDAAVDVALGGVQGAPAALEHDVFDGETLESELGGATVPKAVGGIGGEVEAFAEAGNGRGELWDGEDRVGGGMREGSQFEDPVEGVAAEGDEIGSAMLVGLGGVGGEGVVLEVEVEPAKALDVVGADDALEDCDDSRTDREEGWV